MRLMCVMTAPFSLQPKRNFYDLVHLTAREYNYTHPPLEQISFLPS